MFRYVSPIALILWATTSTAAIENSDFWFHNDGDTIFIDGPRGAPLHIDYIGAPLTKPLTVRVTPNNPKLKIAAPICTFTKKNDDCRLTVQLKNQSEKVYGLHHFTVTEVGASQGVLKAQAASDTVTVGFGVGLQGKDMPPPITWKSSDVSGRLLALPVIITNATSQIRVYQSDIYSESPDNPRITKAIELPSRQSCYLDIFTTRRPDLYMEYLMAPNGIVKDITNPSDNIFNGAYETIGLNITTCSAMGNNRCASNKWSSWSVGLANLGSKDLEGGLKAGQVETLRDNSWESNAGSRDSWIYFKAPWSRENLAVLLIQGSTDGSVFDSNVAAPSILEIKSAPPCSDYIKGDPSVTYKVIADVYGPGSVTMSGGKQCVIVRVPNSEFTRCTGSGIKDRIYEITAVPEAGKTFKGWNSKGLCDDAKTTCRFPLTSEVSIQPLFW